MMNNHLHHQILVVTLETLGETEFVKVF